MKELLEKILVELKKQKALYLEFYSNIDKEEQINFVDYRIKMHGIQLENLEKEKYQNFTETELGSFGLKKDQLQYALDVYIHQNEQIKKDSKYKLF